MKNCTFSMYLVMISLLSCALTAEEPLAKRLPTDDLTSTFLAKYQKTGDKEVVAIRLSKWKAEPKLRTYQITVEVVETRTRVVKDKSGNEVEQEYEVKVPVTEERTESFVEYTPLLPLKGEVLLTDLKAWNIKGKPLTSDELKTALTKPTYLFGLSEEPKANQPPIDPFFASALRSDLIFVHSPKINELYEQSIEYAMPIIDPRAGFRP